MKEGGATGLLNEGGGSNRLAVQVQTSHNNYYYVPLN